MFDHVWNDATILLIIRDFQNIWTLVLMQIDRLQVSEWVQTWFMLFSIFHFKMEMEIKIKIN